MRNKECLAMLLAGGEGKRLQPLTQQWAKPAVPFGGKHRIIDFPINNCRNSLIDDIGVLTQYQAESIHSYLKSPVWEGQDHPQGGTVMLPSTRVGDTGYAGTADAIYQNIDYIDRHNPDHVLILSGDHIYQMDYRPLLAYHKAKNTAATIVVKHVPWEETSRFGIMSTDGDDRITDFAEKPSAAQSNLASMGIYMFRWADLRKALVADAAEAASSHDFGKDIIPKLLHQNESIYAYAFDGYWRDVGTIDSLWESNMDLLEGHFTFNHHEWPMNASARSTVLPSRRSAFAHLRNSLLQQGAEMKGTMNKSILSYGCQVGYQSQINESFIMPNVKIGKHVKINRAIIGEGAIIEDYAVIGEEGQEIAVIAPGERVKANVYLSPAFDRVKEMKGRIVSSAKMEKQVGRLQIAE